MFYFKFRTYERTEYICCHNNSHFNKNTFGITMIEIDNKFRVHLDLHCPELQHSLLQSIAPLELPCTSGTRAYSSWWKIQIKHSKLFQRTPKYLSLLLVRCMSSSNLKSYTKVLYWLLKPHSSRWNMQSYNLWNEPRTLMGAISCL